VALVQFWKLALMDNNTKKYKNINGVGKAHCMLAFVSGGLNAIERACKFLRKGKEDYIKQIHA